MTFASHTLVKNGTPFIDLVLRQVIPFANRCLITVSTSSDDGTFQLLDKLESEHPDKIIINFENVDSPGELTQERQALVDETEEDWILFLDDDDYWPTSSLASIMSHMLIDIDALAVRPYQVIDSTRHDAGWGNKWFTKWFKNGGIEYRHPWPKDLIYKNGELLYWKKNPRVKRIEVPFFHLSYIKNHSFRLEEWASQYKHKVGPVAPISEIFTVEMEKIWKKLV